MKRGTIEHPKTAELTARLGIPKYAVVGLLESLFHVTARVAPRGDIGRYSNRAIALSIGWDGDPDELIESMRVSGWLDEHTDSRLIVHDWHEHADDATKKRLARARQDFVRTTADNGGQRQPMSADVAPASSQKPEASSPDVYIPPNPPSIDSDRSEPRPDSADAYDAGFEFPSLIEVVPPSQRKFRGRARDEWVRAVRNGAEPADIIDGARRYYASPEGTGPYCRGLLSWLKDEGWTEPAEAWKRRDVNGQQPDRQEAANNLAARLAGGSGPAP